MTHIVETAYNWDLHGRVASVERKSAIVSERLCLGMKKEGLGMRCAWIEGVNWR
jgi:hypothetical protein